MLFYFVQPLESPMLLCVLSLSLTLQPFVLYLLYKLHVLSYGMRIFVPYGVYVYVCA